MGAIKCCTIVLVETRVQLPSVVPPEFGGQRNLTTTVPTKPVLLKRKVIQVNYPDKLTNVSTKVTEGQVVGLHQ